MYHSIHSEFIETPLLRILEEGIQACRPLGDGIQTEPMKEYFLSSLFLRMTGAQEQKMKCVCWELATHDYTFRWKFLNDSDNLNIRGEFSSFAQKERVYHELLRQILLFNEGIRPSDCTSLRGRFLDEVRDKLEPLLGQEPLCYWLQREILDLYDDRTITSNANGPSSPENFNFSQKEWPSKPKYSLLQKYLKAIYKPVVEQHRHRCAHNLTSIQNNLPSLMELSQEYSCWNNYAYRFFILILIDEIFMDLYKVYRELVEISPRS